VDESQRNERRAVMEFRGANVRKLVAVGALFLLCSAARGFADYAFVWANLPTGSGYLPDPKYQHNSTGAKNSITRARTGVYRVLMPGVQPKPWGNVQVTAYGASTDFCNVGTWTKTGVADLVIEVYCFNDAGNPVDTPFTALYHDNEDAEGGGGLAYAFADRPLSLSAYYGQVAYSYNSEWPNRAMGVSIGGVFIDEDEWSYRVVFPGWERLRQHPVTGLWENSLGNLQLTTVDSGPNRCRVAEHYYTGFRSLVVVVHCSTPTRFSLTHFRDRVPGTPRTIGGYVSFGIYNDGYVASYYNPLAPSTIPVVTRTSCCWSGWSTGYRVDIPRLADAYTISTVQVTGQETDVYGNPTYCKVRSWSRIGEDVSVFVDCYDSFSTTSPFYLSFVTDGTY
jgi:hypothetical protein